MKYFLLILFFFFPNFLYAQRINEWKTVSPNKSLQFILSNNEGKLYYHVLSGNDIIVKSSRLGIERADESFTDYLSLINATATTIDEHYTLKIGKKKINYANANGTSIEFKNNHNAIVYVDMRVYNDGVAFRYRFEAPAKKVTVKNEATEFVIPEGKTWIQNYDLPAQWNPSYEGPYMNAIPAGTTAKDSSGWAFPALFQSMITGCLLQKVIWMVIIVVLIYSNIVKMEFTKLLFPLQVKQMVWLIFILLQPFLLQHHGA